MQKVKEEEEGTVFHTYQNCYVKDVANTLILNQLLIPWHECLIINQSPSHFLNYTCTFLLTNLIIGRCYGYPLQMLLKWTKVQVFDEDLS